jgi:pimeloyl-ACP methyl ester carboxylesterase
MIWVLILFLLCIAAAAPFVVESRRKPMDATARSDAPGHMATLSQGQTHYQWLGPLRGPVAVCVHGLSTPSFVWTEMADGLAAMGYRVLTYDLYGRGYSDRPPGKQDRAFFVRQLEDLLVDQKISGDFTLLGYSMGGAIATCYASTHPDRVRQLVLLAPCGLGSNMGQMARFIRRTPLIGDWLMLALFARSHRDAVKRDRQVLDVEATFFDRQIQELQYRGFIPSVLASMRGIMTDDLSADHYKLHHEGVPVLAVWGRKDQTIPISAMGRLATVSRSTKQEVMDDAGHGLPYTHSDAVLNAIRVSLRDGLT